MTQELTFEATSRRLDGGKGLHYHEAGDGPPLLLLHGSGPGVSGWSNFGRNLPNLAARFRTIVLDMPGFGRSPLPQLDRPYPKVAADAACSLLDALGIARASVLGNSMGGYVAGELALAHPDRVDRLVLMGPGGFSANLFAPEPSEGAKRLGEFMMAPSKESMAAWIDTMVANKAVVDDALVEERLANALAPGAMAAAGAIFGSLGLAAGEPPLWARAAAITHPTLVTWGRDDRMMPLEGGLFAFRRLPDAELHVFSGCGHWAQVERKDEFERLVTEFLTRPEVPA